MPNENVLSVSQYLKLVNTVLREYVPSQEFVVEGEISGFLVKDGKWVIFDLKDEGEQKTLVKCFSTTFKVGSAFEDGMRVRVSGFPVVKQWSAFQIDVQTIEPVGEGGLKRAYELLKKKLTEEGLFDAARKRPLPRFLETIGLVTSKDAAAYGDFLRILNNRWGGVRVLHANVHVQGREAVPEILGAISYLNALPDEDRPDVIVLTRGGGSLEDLHAFNDERVARAVFQSKVPVVCGVGHERDESLCDFAADVRASTPSNAAERVAPDRREVGYAISKTVERLTDRLESELAERGRLIDRVARGVRFVLEQQKGRLVIASSVVEDRMAACLPRLSDRIISYERLLKNVDPTKVLARGYSIVRARGKILKDAARVDAGESIAVQFARSALDATVVGVKRKPQGQQKLV